MGSPLANAKNRDTQYIRGKMVVPVTFLHEEVKKAPNMAQDAHVVITRPECVKPGLRLGDWSQVEK